MTPITLDEKIQWLEERKEKTNVDEAKKLHDLVKDKLELDPGSHKEELAELKESLFAQVVFLEGLLQGPEVAYGLIAKIDRLRVVVGI